MEKKPPKPMTPFDELLTSPKLQMLKLFLPYTPDSNQQFLGVFIKFMELEHTISFFQNSRTALHNQTFQNGKPPSPADMLKDLKPYMPPQQSEMMDTFLNIMNIMEMASTFQENSQGETAGDFAGGLNPMDMMMGMLTPDQQNMYQMYNSMFSDNFGSKDTGQNTPDKDSQTDEGFVKESSVQDAAGNQPSWQDASENQPSWQDTAGNQPSWQNAAGNEEPGQDAASDYVTNIEGDDTHEQLDEPSGNEEY